MPKLAKELFSWLTSIARQSDKYSDKVKIVNLRFFQLSISQLHVPVLDSFVVSAVQQVNDCIIRYINWMVEYEFPSLSALASRMEGVGTKISNDELAVYIRRKDVLNVIKELETKPLEVVILNLRKRLEKHFKSDFDGVSRVHFIKIYRSSRFELSHYKTRRSYSW